jgi:hypothetical protein
VELELVSPSVFCKRIPERPDPLIPSLQVFEPFGKTFFEMLDCFGNQPEGLQTQLGRGNTPCRVIVLVKRVFSSAGSGRVRSLEQDNVIGIQLLLPFFKERSVREMQHAVGRYDRTSLAWAHESPRGELQDSSTRFRILNDFGKLILSGCLSSLNWNPREHREKNQTCCDAMKQGSDELLDQHGHILDIAQYTFEVPKYAQLATMQHKPKRSELWRNRRSASSDENATFHL